MRLTFSFLLALSFIIQGCNGKGESKSPKEDRKVVARAFDREFTHEDLKKSLPKSFSGKDSARIAERLIRNWMKEQVMLHEAEEALTPEQKDVEEQLRNYRNSLLIYAYQKEYLSSQVDTSISREAIKAYYEKNKENFQLKDYLVKCSWIQLDTSMKEIPELKNWLYSDKKEDRKALSDFCREKAFACHLADSSWIYFDDLLQSIPLEVYNRASFLKENEFIQFTKDRYNYYLRIIAHELKGDISPLSLERENIRSILINKRKKELIGNKQEMLMRKARSNKDIQVY